MSTFPNSNQAADILKHRHWHKEQVSEWVEIVQIEFGEMDLPLSLVIIVKASIASRADGVPHTITSAN
jgi:hypothetical protein